MVRKVFNNWVLKLIALLIAVALWFSVVYMENPPGTATFTNIEVEFVNEDLLEDQNLVYEVLNDTDVVSRVQVKGGRQELDEMKELVGVDVITATADFADLDEETGTIPITFSVISKYADDVTVVDTSAEVELSIEEKKSKNVTVRAITSGEVAEGYEVTGTSTDINTITITGAVSKVDQVSYAGVVQSVSGSTSDITTSGTILLFDKEDNQLDLSGVQKTMSSTGITIQIQAYKDLSLVYEVYGEPAEGYWATGEVISTVETVRVVGSSSVLDALESIVVGGEGSPVDITEASGDVSKTFSIRTYLPSNVSLSSSSATTATVTVKVEPLQEKTYRIPAENISITNVPEGYEMEIPEDTSYYSITLSGLQASLDAVDASALYAEIDLTSWLTSEGLEDPFDGTYEITVDLEFTEELEVISPLTVTVVIGAEGTLHPEEETESETDTTEAETEE